MHFYKVNLLCLILCVSYIYGLHYFLNLKKSQPLPLFYNSTIPLYRSPSHSVLYVSLSCLHIFYILVCGKLFTLSPSSPILSSVVSKMVCAYFNNYIFHFWKYYLALFQGYLVNFYILLLTCSYLFCSIKTSHLVIYCI